MDTAIIAAIVAACAAVLTSIIASIISWRSTVYSFQKPKQINILKEQYIKVISPLHEIFIFEADSIENKKTKAYKILKEHYHLVPREIIELFVDYEYSNTIYSKIYELVIECDKYSRRELGYSQVNSRDSIGRILGSTLVPEIIGLNLLFGSIIKKK